MTASLSRYTHLLGRILLSVIFLFSGYSKLTHWSSTAAAMASARIPAASLSLSVAILLEIAGGLAILAGYRTRLAGLLLFLYLAVVTLVFHNFWSYHGAAEQAQAIQFLKNLAILGGLMGIVAEDDAGVPSRDPKRLHPSADLR